MDSLKNHPLIFIFGLVLSVSLFSCATSIPAMTPTLTKKENLVPFMTQVPSLTPEVVEFQTREPRQTPVPTASPTPILYTIKKGDTLSSIAYLQGTKLKDLIAANPGVDPGFLTIGMTLTIPITSMNAAQLLGPTPIPIVLSEPLCYPQADGGLYCLSIAHNTQSFDAENVTAEIILTTQNLDESVKKVAIAPLNILPSGTSTPLVVYFPPPVPSMFQPQATLISVLPLPAESRRYLDLNLNIASIDIAKNRLQATLSGKIFLPPDQPSAQQVRVLAIAYDASTNPIGFRLWESETTLLAGELLQFDFQIFSLGPKIVEINAYAEAQP